MTRQYRRYGVFEIQAHLVSEYDSDLLRIMGKCAIFRAEHMYVSDTIRYHAACDMFREVGENEMIPEYQWYFNSDGEMWCEESEVRRCW